MKHNIYCQQTGVQIASFELIDSVAASCASMGWQAEWKHLVSEHPMFSLTTNACLRTARIKFRELAAAGPAINPFDPAAIAGRVAFVAVLKNMGSLVRREPNANPVPMLPSAAVVIAHGQQLLELAYWYANAQSPKFQFPKLNVARINSNSELMDIGAYLAICSEAKRKWTEAEASRAVNNALRDIEGEDFLAAAKRAERAVIGGSARRLPKTSLWNWLLAAMAAENRKYYDKWIADANEGVFFKSMFFTATDTGLKKYSVDDVQALEDILMGFAPLGTTPFHAFRTELDRMKAVIQKTTKSFTVDWMTLTVGNTGIKQSVQGMTPEGALIASEEDKASAELATQPEPKREDYPDTVSHIRAKALWQLAKYKSDAAAKQSTRNSIF
jgi:hypothetical protein